MQEQFEPDQPESLDQYIPNENEDEQEYDQGNRVQYDKLEYDQWNWLEKKSFNYFELRVLDSLLQLGNQQAERVLTKPLAIKEISEPSKQTKKKGGKIESESAKKEERQIIQDVQISEICLGQEIYINVIRPRLVELRIVNKIQAEEDEEESSQQKAKEQKKVKAKKPGAGQKKGGAPVVKKEDLMRLQLSKDKVADQTMKMFQMMGVLQQQNVDIKLFEEEFLRVEQASKRIKSLKWLELKFSALLVYANQLIKCHLESKVREEYAFELIYFLKNVFIKYQDYKGQSYFDATAIEHVAPEVIGDVRRKLIELNKHFKFSNRVLFNRYPRLVIDTDLNQSFLQTDVKPYKSQVTLIEKLAKAVTPQLIFLNTMVGTGKTVLSVAVSQFLERIRDELEGKSEEYIEQMYNDPNIIMTSDLRQMQLLYCCPLSNVRTQVAAAAYEKKLKFGIAAMWKDPQSTNVQKQTESKKLGFVECPRIINSYSCQSQAYPTLIISDFKSTLELLKEKYTMSSKEKTVIRWQGYRKREILKENPAKNGDQYILFIDEPTVDADFPNSNTTQFLVEIMRYAPPITILSSATLPRAERLPNFIKLFQNRYRDAEISTIQSEQFQIGCQIFSHLGQKFLPHYKVTTKAQLEIVLKRLTQNPFMQRCYNANAYCELNDRMKKCGLANIEDFEEFDLITQEIVQQKSMDLLKRLLNEEEPIIAKVCTEAEPEELDDEGDGTMEINFNEEEPKSNPIDDEDKIKFAAPYKTLKIRELAGKMAHKFSGGCLITVIDPVKLVREKFGWLLKNVRTAADYIRHYQKSLEVLQKLKAKKEKEIDNEDERSKQVQALEESMNIAVDFPDKLKINTLEHYKRFFAGNKPHLLNRYRARKAFSIEAINLELDVPDDILLFLFAGIATYTDNGSSNLDPDYYKEVQRLAQNGQLAFIVSDDSMVYGVNYPLNHVVILDEMAERRSLGAIFQLIGRAGRVGVSWVANAYLEQKTFDRLVSYLEGKELSEKDPRDEAVNMERLAIQLIEQLRTQAQYMRTLRLQQQQESQQEKQEQKL